MDRHLNRCRRTMLIVICAIAAITGRLAIADDFPFVLRGESDHLSDLGKAARELKPKKETRHERRERRRESSCTRCNQSPCTCESGNSISGELFGQMFLAALSAPFTVPIALLNDGHDIEARFPDYPYADDLPGSLVKETPYQGHTKDWVANLQLFAIPETSDINRYGGRIVLDSAVRWGIDTETNFWYESSSAGSDHVWTGDANVFYRFAESEEVQMRAGFGVNWLSDRIGTNAGLNFTYGLDWFPRKPFTISTVFDFGSIGRGTLFHNRTTAGLMMGPVEAFAGYDYFQIGSTSFHGPVAGLGFRF